MCPCVRANGVIIAYTPAPLYWQIENSPTFTRGGPRPNMCWAKTTRAAHRGFEAFYVLAGRLGPRTPHGVSQANAGQSMNGHGADMAMEVFSAGTTDLDQLAMFVVDATRPFSAPAKFE